MTEIALNVETTISTDGKREATIHSVLVPHVNNVTEIFLKYCKDNNLPLTTQDDIENAALEYAKTLD